MNNVRLTVYDLPHAHWHTSPSIGHSFTYAAHGDIEITHNGSTTVSAKGEGCFLAPGSRVRGVGWLFELAPISEPISPHLRPGLQLSVELALDPATPAIVRADSVSSASGAQTPRHGHRGPGVRRLVEGALMAQVGDTTSRITAGQAWFETGTDWVVGENISGAQNRFIRVMVLPHMLKGGISSFVPASPDDAAKPRGAEYHIFGEVDLATDIFGVET